MFLESIERTWPQEGRSLVLSRLEENAVAEAAQAVGLDPQEFEWRTRPPEKFGPSPYRRIIHKPTGSHLEFSLNSNGVTGHWLDWSPMFPSGQRYMSATTWASASRVIDAWVSIVKQNHEAPDLWAAVRAQTALPTAAARTSEPSDPFTPSELKLLEAGLDEVEHFIISTQPLDPGGRDQVHKRFGYLRDAARRGVRKIDWLNIFVGQVVGMIMERILDPASYAPVMTHAGKALASVFKFGAKLLEHAGAG